MPTRDQMVAAFGSEEAYLAHMAAIGRRGGQRKVKKGVAKRGGWRAVVEQAEEKAARLARIDELRKLRLDAEVTPSCAEYIADRIVQLEAEEAQAQAGGER
jgi:hypothetical protein